MSLSDRQKRLAQLASRFTKSDDCAVTTCDSTDTDMVEILPLDPIDHMPKYLPLCNDHQEWATERNELAKEVTDELREERKRIGNNHLDEIQRLAAPDSGELREGKIMGRVEDLAPGGE